MPDECKVLLKIVEVVFVYYVEVIEVNN